MGRRYNHATYIESLEGFMVEQTNRIHDTLAASVDRVREATDDHDMPRWLYYRGGCLISVSSGCPTHMMGRIKPAAN